MAETITKSVPVNLSLPADLAQHLRDEAEANDRTLSAEARRALEAYFGMVVAK